MAQPWNQVIGSLCSYAIRIHPAECHIFRCENLLVDGQNASGCVPQFWNGGRKAVSKPTASVTIESCRGSGQFQTEIFPFEICYRPSYSVGDYADAVRCGVFLHERCGWWVGVSNPLSCDRGGVAGKADILLSRR